jgi:26S proteasome regulatory subunit N4
LIFNPQHGVNMNTSLTTFDGYPRSDIDVAQIRTTRARIIRLKNDHKTLMASLEVAVQERFAAGKATDTSTRQLSAGRGPVEEDDSAQTQVSIEPPFARVNTVVPNSPAEEAGLRVGDKIVKFGNIKWTNHERLTQVARVVQQNERVRLQHNHHLPYTMADYLQQIILVKVLREVSANAASRPLDLRLVPRRGWGGNGLLGCHLLPL